MRASGIGPTVGMNSSVVPGWLRNDPARATNSSKAAGTRRGRADHRRRCGPRRGRTRIPARPRPATTSTSSTMAANCSGFASDRVAPSPMTARRTAECPTKNPAFTARPRSIRSRYSPKEVQSHSPDDWSALQRHALDDRHHASDVVGVARGQRGDGEPAVAPDHRRHAVEGRRSGGVVPEQLGVVVGVHIDEARADDRSVHIDRSSGRLVEESPRPRPGRRRCPRPPRPPGSRSRRRPYPPVRRRRTRQRPARNSSTAASTTVPLKKAGFVPV